ncbi:hypothetical protein BDN72DRAFT_768833 [Pluteus cervinus]|uniref:Uncharacterized protein n=1 Tax=Pluteus cervinus TaxID=181527 RepID=A0ACD3AS45_9AGAR|nr:hypothetical protein BDN72DRAFT_768833 [Pluteus cervinus]
MAPPPPPAGYPPPQDCPILVWMLSLNREYTKEEYTQCYEVVKACIPHVKFAYDYKNPDSFRQIITHMLPLLMMRHRRIPRLKWRDLSTPQGKRWIEQIADDMPPERFMASKIGYHLFWENSLCGMAMTQGHERKVVNIGLAMKQRSVEPKGVSVSTYKESLTHKLTDRESSMLSEDGLTDETILRRLCIILALKQAYLAAIGQPIGFDYRRIDVDIPNNKLTGDDVLLEGWEFRLFGARLGVARGDQLVTEQYDCVCAFFRGSRDTTFIWDSQEKTLESWVQFINIDQMMKVLPKLMA